jgi:hypothetical protein
MLPCSSTGTNTPGSDALARMAFHSGPRSWITVSLVERLQEVRNS